MADATPSPLRIRVPQGLDTLAPVTETALEAAPQRPWGRLERAGFRFVFVYLVLFIPSYPLTILPVVGPIVATYDQLWVHLVPWVGTKVLGLGPIVAGVPNDSKYRFVKALCQLMLAAGAAAIWSALPGRSRHHARLHAWLRVAVRYFLATAMFNYGAVKLFNTQFLPPELDRLIQRYGDSSPTSLLWSFMGYSNAYTTFSGAGEVLGALLLFFRRTTTLGALVLLPVLANIVMLNFCYDVNAKLLSTHLLLMTIFLLAPELQRLANVVVLNRPTVPAVLPRPQPARWMAWSRLVLKTTFVGLVVVFLTGGALALLFQKIVPYPPLYGLYEVETFTLNDKTLLPLVTDGDRWRWFVVGRYDQVIVETMTGGRAVFGVRHDTTTRTLSLSEWKSGSPVGTLSYARTAPDRLSAWGAVGSDRLAMQLRRVDESTFLLVRRGFRWTAESFNGPS